MNHIFAKNLSIFYWTFSWTNSVMFALLPQDDWITFTSVTSAQVWGPTRVVAKQLRVPESWQGVNDDYDDNDDVDEYDDDDDGCRRADKVWRELLRTHPPFFVNLTKYIKRCQPGDKGCFISQGVLKRFLNLREIIVVFSYFWGPCSLWEGLHGGVWREQVHLPASRAGRAQPALL